MHVPGCSPKHLSGCSPMHAPGCRTMSMSLHMHAPGIIDALSVGCVPVLFHPRQAELWQHHWW